MIVPDNTPKKILSTTGTIGLGTSLGITGGLGLTHLLYGPSLSHKYIAYPTSSELKSIQEAYIRKIRGVKGVVFGGLIGTGIGLGLLLKKDKIKIPSLISIPSTISGILASTLFYRHRGKLTATLLGDLGKIDYLKNYNSSYDYLFKKENWLNKKDIKPITNIPINEEQLLQLSKEKSGIPESPKIKTPLTNFKNVEEAWEQLPSSSKPFIGGDPEVKLYRKMFGKVLPVQTVPDFASKYFKKISPNIIRDLSVEGLEINVPPGPVDAFFQNTKDIVKEIQKKLGHRYVFDTASVRPFSHGYKFQNVFSSKTAGGHLHFENLIPQELKNLPQKEIKRILSNRYLFIGLPFDLTHPSMPTRVSLLGRLSKEFTELYGEKLEDVRTLGLKLKWEPHPGNINWEHRFSPTYVGDENITKTKVKLMQILANNPKVSNIIDNYMKQLVYVSKNKSKVLYDPQVRKSFIDTYKTVLQVGGIKDSKVDEILNLYEKGKIRKIGN